MTAEVMASIEKPLKNGLSVSKERRNEPLRECVRDALQNYFNQLNGHGTADLYDMVMREVEQPLLETVMKHTGGNQTRASALLGMSRSTLRKKLSQYGLD